MTQDWFGALNVLRCILVYKFINNIKVYTFIVKILEEQATTNLLG